jgi:hypothetical protein
MNVQEKPVRYTVVCPWCAAAGYAAPEHIGKVIKCCECDREYRAIGIMPPPHVDEYQEEAPDESSAPESLWAQVRDRSEWPIVYSAFFVFIAILLLIAMLCTPASATAAPLYGGYGAYGNAVMRGYGNYGNRINGYTRAVRSVKRSQSRRARAYRVNVYIW